MKENGSEKVGEETTTLFLADLVAAAEGKRACTEQGFMA
jgi:hypothetical protein